VIENKEATRVLEAVHNAEVAPKSI
jgi:hypothetical protein